jgi:cytochrome P450
MGQITFTDLLSQATKRDPITFFTRLREQGPLINLATPLSMGTGESWIATTYDDAIAILKDPRFIKDMQKFSAPDGSQASSGENTSMIQQFLTWRRDMLTVDQPNHLRQPCASDAHRLSYHL